MKAIAIIAVAVFIVVYANIWAVGRDAEIRAASKLYTDCVKKEYGMTPLKYYEEQKKYPTCGN